MSIHQGSWMDQLFVSQKENMTEKQISIIMTAIQLFSEKGYSATTTREIAKQTGVSEGTIFKHYATKKDLMLSICDLIIANIAQPLFIAGLEDVLISPYDTLDDFLQALMVNRITMIKENIQVFKLLLQEVPFQPEIRKSILKNAARVPITEGVNRLKARKLLIDLPTPQLIDLLITGIFGYFASRYIIMPELFLNDEQEDLQNFIHFMARGLAPTDPNINAIST